MPSQALLRVEASTTRQPGAGAGAQHGWDIFNPLTSSAERTSQQTEATEKSLPRNNVSGPCCCNAWLYDITTGSHFLLVFPSQSTQSRQLRHRR
jgi:hypothetical protein